MDSTSGLPNSLNYNKGDHIASSIKFNLPLNEDDDNSTSILTPRVTKDSLTLDLSPGRDAQSGRTVNYGLDSTRQNNKGPKRPNIGRVSMRKNLGLDDLDDIDDTKSKPDPDLSARSQSALETPPPTEGKRKTSPRSLMPLKSPAGKGYGNLSVLVASQKQILQRRKASSAHTNTRILSPGECIEMQIKRRDQMRQGGAKSSTFSPRAIDFSARRKSAGVRKIDGVSNINRR